jgi:hypothetical protein
MILITGFYHDPDPLRRGELLECIKRNVANQRIEEVHIFIEDATEPEAILPDGANGHRSKLKLIRSGKRATFKSLFDYANEKLKGRAVAIANADIFFDDSLKLLNGYDLSAKLICLSRWDVQADGSTVFFEHPSSQDAWIFQSPIPEINCDFYLGLPACDNRLAWEAEHAGLEISNPARTLHANHLHLTGIRRYREQQRLAGPVKSISATALETPYPSKLGPPPSAPCAAIAFRETMGFTIATLDLGASSHNNDDRPFESIPESLQGRRFTQAVSGTTSEIEIEFLSAGKLYVLVGPDWWGHAPATDWLRETGYKEDLPSLRTTRGTGFEVWSLVAEAGERFVIPIQVMLVSDHLVKRTVNHNWSAIRSKDESALVALTSLSPNLDDLAHISECISSWRRAGLPVFSFNHPSEIPELEKHFAVDFVPVEETSAATFGRHYVPVNALLDWAGRHNGPVLIINSDIELQMQSWELQRARWLAEDGLCYFVRFNHDGDVASAWPEPFGIDAFLFHGRDANLFPRSFMSLGKPHWDYWVPHTFAAHGRQLHAVEFPAAFHLQHQSRMSWDEWYQCALEFERVVDERDRNKSFNACMSRANRVRRSFDEKKVPVPQSPPGIRDWVQQTFAAATARTFVTFGSGSDAAWMADISGVKIYSDQSNEPKQNDHATLDGLCTQHQIGVIDFMIAKMPRAEEMICRGQAALGRTRYLLTGYCDDAGDSETSLNRIVAMLPAFRVVEVWPNEVLLENQRLK